MLPSARDMIPGRAASPQAVTRMPAPRGSAKAWTGRRAARQYLRRRIPAAGDVERGIMREASRGVLFTGLIGIGTLATWTLLGAPTVVPKPGGAAPKPTPAPLLKLPASAKKSNVKLVPNLPNASK